MASSPRSLTTSVAPNSLASAIRSLCRPMMMICSAPRRLAAITPQRPTASSPTTATRWPGATLATTAAWWPVPMDVREREQRRQQRVVLAGRDRVERPVGVGDAHGLGLGCAEAVAVEEAAVHAGRMQSLAAEGAGAVAERKRHHDEVTWLEFRTSAP